MIPRLIGWVVGLASFVLISAGSGQERTPTSGQDLAALHKSLREVIAVGADLFNLQGDYPGCYRLYQGSLLSIKPLLKPEMRAEIERALADADKKANASERAHHLRVTIDIIREQIKPMGLVPPPPVIPRPPVLKKAAAMTGDDELIRLLPKIAHPVGP